MDNASDTDLAGAQLHTSGALASERTRPESTDGQHAVHGAVAAAQTGFDPAATDGDSQTLEVLLTSVYAGCDLSEVQMVMRYCRAVGLNPLHKPVHVLMLRERADRTDSPLRPTVVPGIGMYRTLAARCGCAGIDEPVFGPQLLCGEEAEPVAYPQWCRVTVHRRLATGEVVPFTATEFWRENVAWSRQESGALVPNAMWSRRPYGQLAKCAEAQALRKGFPEIGAQPVAEELDGKQALPASAINAALAAESEAAQDIQMPVQRAANAAGCAAPGRSPGSGNQAQWTQDIEYQTATADQSATPAEDAGAQSDPDSGATPWQPVSALAQGAIAQILAQGELPLHRSRQERQFHAHATHAQGAQALNPNEAQGPGPLVAHAEAETGLQQQRFLMGAAPTEATEAPDAQAQDAAAVQEQPAIAHALAAPQAPVWTADVSHAANGAAITQHHSAGLATAGERAYIARRVLGKNMTITQALAAAGLPVTGTLEGLTNEGFAALRGALA